MDADPIFPRKPTTWICRNAHNNVTTQAPTCSKDSPKCSDRSWQAQIEADNKILAEMKKYALQNGKAPPWFNEVDPTKPLAPQVQAFNERRAAK